MKTTINKQSYQSANAYPVKMLNTNSWFNGKSIVPNHLQLFITNKCNLKCNFCSCADRDLSKWLTLEQVVEAVTKFKALGGKSVTMAGGGDPTVHPKLNEIVEAITDLGLKVGLVTNGIRLSKFTCLDRLTWCRISLSYCNPIRADWLDLIRDIPIDWAFSYVYTDDFELCQQAVTDSEHLNITHMRIVGDINNPKPLPKFANDSHVIYQARDEYTQGAKKCYIALMKPLLDADGLYYPCCGVQYARELEVKKTDLALTMGSDFDAFSKAQVPFDGSACTKCYYDQYNKLMAQILESSSPDEEYERLNASHKSELNHLEFL